MSKPTLKFSFTVRNQTSEEFTVHRPDFVIGRSSACRVRIPFPEVSREHCQIVVGNDNIIRFKDLRTSGMGIWHNGRREHDGILAVGDKLFIGYTCVELLEFIPAAQAESGGLSSCGQDSQQVFGDAAADAFDEMPVSKSAKPYSGFETSVLPAVTLLAEMPSEMSCSMSTTDLFNSLLGPGQEAFPHTQPAPHGGKK